MKRRTLGYGLEVSAFGIGCMPITDNYGPADEAEGVRTLRAALDAGVNFFDTAETYGHDSANEIIVGRALAGRRHEAVISTKFGMAHVPYTDQLTVDSRPEIVKPSCEGSLRRLNTDYIDLYIQHRVDPNVPIEETWGALKELVDEGKVRYIGMSEPGIDTLRRAHAVHPVSVAQNEYSLFSRDPEGEMLDTLRELGIGLMPFAPLCRGFLSGKFRSPDDFAPNDVRRFLPRFQGDNFHKNLELVDRVNELATQREISATQFALAWVLAQGDDIVPIPGTETREKLNENVRAAEIELSDEDLAALEAIMPNGAYGDRRMPAAQFTHGAEARPTA